VEYGVPGVLRLVLGDQISDGRLSSLRDLDRARDTVLFAEVRAETDYVKHHKKKIALIFAGMRGFADRLRAEGTTVRYVGLEDPDNIGSLLGEVRRALAEHAFDKVIVTAPGEYRLMSEFEAFAAQSNVPFVIREDDRFLCTPLDFAQWAEGRRELRMEFFYRDMRKRYGLLMDGDKPAGGAWNFDKENRKAMPKRLTPPHHRFVAPNPTTERAIADVARIFPDYFGTLDGIGFATTPDEAEVIVESFIEQILPGFGDYQDAMVENEPWMWHSIVSAAMNLGLIDPLDLCRRAEAEYRAGRAPLNAVEGFIRQILGWREFMRGIYWLKMPAFKQLNALDADRQLPWFYWSGETDMVCVRDAVRTTAQNAYAHHIQRLMVTGNLAMLLGVHPNAINDWYMVVYADAYEWVELPNVHGMATFADGGIIGSKPYAASGAYINRMSDYCGRCRYDVSQRTGPDACPFNALYWDFMIRNEPKLAGNKRMDMPYRTLARMKPETRAAIQAEAERIKRAFGAVPVRDADASPETSRASTARLEGVPG
jgi:deoxyribodipyrimidine photolyase-related protein